MDILSQLLDVDPEHTTSLSPLFMDLSSHAFVTLATYGDNSAREPDYGDSYLEAQNSPKYNDISDIVKEQLFVHKYAKIHHKQKMSKQQHYHEIITSFVESSYTGNQIFPGDLLQLISGFYPLFYWNDNYISLQSIQTNNSDTFIISKECCKLSQFLQSLIESKISRTILVTNIESKILELLVEYISNMFGKRYIDNMMDKETNDDDDAELDRGMYRVFSGEWDSKFIDTLDEDTLLHLLSAAKHMKCQCLVDIVHAQIEILNGKTSDYQGSMMLHALLDSHFNSFHS